MSARVSWRRRLANRLVRLAERLDPPRETTIRVGDVVIKTMKDGRVSISGCRVVHGAPAAAAEPAA